MTAKRCDWFARAAVSGLWSPLSTLRSFTSILVVSEAPELARPHTQVWILLWLLSPLPPVSSSSALLASPSLTPPSLLWKERLRRSLRGELGGHFHNETVQVTVFQVAAIIFLTATGRNWSAENDSLMTSYRNFEFNGIWVNGDWDVGVGEWGWEVGEEEIERQPDRRTDRQTDRQWDWGCTFGGVYVPCTCS